MLAFNGAAVAQNDTIDNRLTLGVTVEAAYRYHVTDRQHEVDIPNSTASLGFDMGNGWSMGSDITFGLIRTSSHMASGEAASKGHEVALEQLWIEKSWHPSLNLRIGHLIVPVGAVSAYNHPDLFAGTYRPLGESHMVIDTWHENGISLWGTVGSKRHWHYELLVLPQTDYTLETDCGWGVHDSLIAHDAGRKQPSVAARIDNSSLSGLRLSLSGHLGSTHYDNIDLGESHEGYRNTVALAAFDFAYDNKGWRIIGNADIGCQYNTLHSVERKAYALGLQAGYDILRLWCHPTTLNTEFSKQLYLFARYDSYNMPFAGMEQEGAFQTLCAGINYYVTPDIVVKAEGGLLQQATAGKTQPWLGLSILWSTLLND